MGTHNICLYEEVDEKCHEYNPKTYGIAWLCDYRDMCGNLVDTLFLENKSSENHLCRLLKASTVWY